MNPLADHVGKILDAIAAQNARGGEAAFEGYEIPPSDGVPSSLSSALIEWVEYGDTPAEEIAQVAGWTVAEVARCLRWAVAKD